MGLPLGQSFRYDNACCFDNMKYLEAPQAIVLQTSKPHPPCRLVTSRQPIGLFKLTLVWRLFNADRLLMKTETSDTPVPERFL